MTRPYYPGPCELCSFLAWLIGTIILSHSKCSLWLFGSILSPSVTIKVVFSNACADQYFADCKWVILSGCPEFYFHVVLSFLVLSVMWTLITFFSDSLGFPDSSVGKESVGNAGDLDSTTGLGRSPGEGEGYSDQYYSNPVFWPIEFHG